MRFKVDHDYHIHSQLSECSQHPEQTKENILKYAKDNGLSKIVITDHYWDSNVEGAPMWYQIQNFSHISQIKPLPKAEGIEFLFGAETDVDLHGTVGVSKPNFDDFDFVVIPTTHFHMAGFTIPEEAYRDTSVLARLWTQKLEKLLSMDLPFYKIGIAHLACTLINNKSREDYLKTLDLIPTEDMERLFKKAAELGVGIELNQDDMRFSDQEADRVLRMFKIAKKMGCKFYLGSDSHTPNGFLKAKEIFERAVDLLDLKETDKFHIGK